MRLGRVTFLPNGERAESASHGNAVDHDVIDRKDGLAFDGEHDPAVDFCLKQ